MTTGVPRRSPWQVALRSAAFLTANILRPLTIGSFLVGLGLMLLIQSCGPDGTPPEETPPDQSTIEELATEIALAIEWEDENSAKGLRDRLTRRDKRFVDDVEEIVRAYMTFLHSVDWDATAASNFFEAKYGRLRCSERTIRVYASLESQLPPKLRAQAWSIIRNVGFISGDESVDDHVENSWKAKARLYREILGREMPPVSEFDEAIRKMED